MDKRERDIEQRLRVQIGKMGGLFYKFTSPGNDGVPDRIAVMPGGRIWFVELKTKTGRLSAVQVLQIRRLHDRGANVFVVWDEEGADELIRRMGGDAL